MNNLKLEKKDKALIITINRPDKLNALNVNLINELNGTFSDHRDDNSIKAVIVTGAGSKSFVAGADIKEMSAFSPSDAASYSNSGIELFNNIESWILMIFVGVYILIGLLRHILFQNSDEELELTGENK